MFICSLLLALHALTTVGVSVVFFVVIIGFLTGSMHISLLLVISYQLDSLSCFHLYILRSLHFKRLLNLSNSSLGHLLRESNFKDDVKISEVVGLLVEGKTFVLNSLDVVRFNYFTYIVLNSNL